MDAFRRGWIGMALFSAALVLMPILVFGYDPKEPGPAPSATPSPLSVAGRSARTDPFAAKSSLAPLAPLSFSGIRSGEIISGFRAIRVETTGYSGPLEYVLNGPIDPFQQDVQNPPYVFTPHPGGWQTTAVPDGLYTLTAIPTRSGYTQISVSFTVSNTRGATR